VRTNGAHEQCGQVGREIAASAFKPWIFDGSALARQVQKASA
jgi:hypothetical protein